jgi:hypothetical protein
MEHKLALEHWVLNTLAFELFSRTASGSSYMWFLTCSTEITAQSLAPVKGPLLLVSQIVGRICAISGRSQEVGSCSCILLGAGRDAVLEGVKGSCSCATKQCVPRIWNLGYLFKNSIIIDDDNEVN